MILTLRPDSWSEAKAIGSNLLLWGFRGQSDARWPLTTSIERKAKTAKKNLSSLWITEQAMLSDFKRYAHAHIDRLPEPDAITDWLSLIQHHGGPTRMLDFTHSFYVAAFFAVEQASQDAVVWAADIFNVHYGASVALGFENGGTWDGIRKKNTAQCEEALRSKKDIPTVIPAEPDQMHQRVWSQQGFFMVCLSLKKTFEYCLAKTLNFPVASFRSNEVTPWNRRTENRVHSDGPNRFPLIKIVLKRDLHIDILRDLNAMNINSATLFPGLDGYARSLSGYIAFDPDERLLDKALKGIKKKG